MADQLTLLGPPEVAPGDELERGYTPERAVWYCMRMLGARLPEPRRIAELHVGGGAWVRGARQLWGERPEILGVDLDPTAPGLALGELDEAMIGDCIGPEVRDRLIGYAPDLVIGNPPFSLALEQIETLRRESIPSAVIAWIMPWSCWGGVKWWPLLVDHPPRWVMPLSPRVWPNIACRETAFYVWWPGFAGPTTILDGRWKA